MEEAGHAIMANTNTLIKGLNLWDFHEMTVAKYLPISLVISKNESKIGLSKFGGVVSVKDLCFVTCNITVDDIFACLLWTAHSLLNLEFDNLCKIKLDESF